MRKQVWLVLGEKRLEVFKDASRSVRHYSMELRLVEAQELAAVLYGFTVCDGTQTIVLETNSTEDQHAWIQSIREEAKRATAVHGVAGASAAGRWG